MLKPFHLLTIILFLALSAASTTSYADTLCNPSSKQTTATSGTLYDSGGPGGNYSNREDCSFLIQPSGGGNPTLSFSQFDIQNADQLNIYDGTNASAPLLVSLTGNSIPADVTSTSGALFLRFTSNPGGNRAGFAASWSVSATPSTEWRLDESSWNGTANEIKDSIGSYHGTAFNSSTVSGQVCKAADLSANSTTDYLSMDSGALNNTTNFTISVWGKTANTGNQALFSASSGSQHNELIMWFPNSSTFTPFLKGDGSNSIGISNIADNNWHHFVWTRNGAQNCFYIDGVLQGCSTKPSQPLSVAANGLIIGQEQDSLGGSFDINQDWQGLVDEPLIFKSALSQSEITAIYNNQSAGNGWDGSSRDCPSLVAQWRMNEFLWSGAAGEVNDASGNGHNATAVNGLTNNDATPALAGTPGTCSYGDFDGSNDYIELPASLPDLTGSFTIAGWINARDLGNDQRIFADDESNSGGFAFSLGDGGNGKLRFFSRNVSPIIVDTQNAVISQNSWHFVAAVHDASTKIRQIYVDGVAVTLNTGSTVSTYTGTWGNDPGTASIGGETNNAGSEATAKWRFNGLIDQVSVYQGALSGGEINQLMRERQPCPGIPRAEWRFDEASWSGTANEVLDSSANNYHGTAFNSTTTAGLVCNAADLTTDSTTDYLSLSSGAFNGVGDFTLSLWANTSNNSGQHTLVSGSSGSQHNELIMFLTNPTTFSPHLKGASSGGNIAVPNVGDGQWHHYVWTRSGATNCLYRDGISQGCVSRSSATLNIASGGLIIGQEQDSLGGSFAINQDWEGLIDEMILFDGALSVSEIRSIYNNNLAGNNWNGAPRNCGAALDHLSISHSGSALTCAAEPVDISAHRSNHTVDTSYRQTINLSTSTNRGDWSIISGNGSLNNGTANDGAATYSFVASDNGSVQLGLANTTIETLNINVSDGTISESSGAAQASEDLDLIFSANGLRFLANGSANNIGTQISGKNSSLSPGAQTLELQAIRTNNAGTCEAALIDSHAIELAYECLSPATCSSNRVAIDGTNIGANNSGSLSNYQAVTLDFGDASDSTAGFVFNYPDAGQIRLHARYSFPGVGPVTGSSNNFVVKPAGLCVEATDASASCPAGNVCSLFKKAGETFNLRVSAVAWQTAGETNQDFCNGNASTPNFQLNAISLGSNLVAPSPGTNAVLGVTSFDMVSADNGVHTLTNQSVSEVGVFTLTATPPSYLGTSIAASSSANIGRFYPDRLEINAGSLIEGCNAGGFSYLGQGFTASYTVTAKNTMGATTTNYRAAFARLDPTAIPASSSLDFGAIDSTLPTLLSSRLTHNSTNFVWNNNGTGTLTSNLTLARRNDGSVGNSIADGPFLANIGVLPEDADLVTVRLADRDLNSDNVGNNDHVQIGASSQRFGRIVIDNAFGPEALDLEVPLRAEYWNNTAFTINSDDNACPGSQFNTGDITITDGDNSDSLTPADISSLSLQPIVLGAGSMTLGAPNKNGPLDLVLTVPDWLLFDSDGNGSDQQPTARAVFGHYRGNDRIIYWREQY